MAGAGERPRLLVFDASDPQNVVVTQVSVPNIIAVSQLYRLRQPLVHGRRLEPLALQHRAGAGYAGDRAGHDPHEQRRLDRARFVQHRADQTTTNPDGSETLEWDLGFSAGNTSQTITWQSSVTGLQPGQSATVAADATVQFTSQGTPGTLTLPDQFVAGDQIIGLTPATQTAAPGAAATYSVTLSNPTSSAVTYNLSVQGVPPSWVKLSSTVPVGAGLTVNVPLVLTSDSFAALDDYGFTVSAERQQRRDGSVHGDLVLQGSRSRPTRTRTASWRPSRQRRPPRDRAHRPITSSN